jgi:uncharacterized protein YqjF (DUF2071 family)
MALPWLLRMRWLDLLFAHWPVPADEVRRLLPPDPDLEIDLFEGAAWLGVVPFTMTDVSARGLPAMPRLSTFPEVNVRTYVRYRGLPGVWFLSLDARSRPTVLGGRLVFHLPYHYAEMTARRRGDTVDYRSERPRARDGAGERARFLARYGAVGPPAPTSPPAPDGGPAQPTFDDWSTVRMRLFAADRRGGIWRTEIEHDPWPLQPAEATIDADGLVAAAGLTLPAVDPILRFSARLDVHGWPPVRA